MKVFLQRLEQVADIVLAPHPAGLREHAGERLLHEVLGFDTGAGQRPRGSEQPIDVIAQRARIQRPIWSHRASQVVAGRNAGGWRLGS